eukprot:scaffold115812_cov29-Tisochrysis_lutea.AAC.1
MPLNSRCGAFVHLRPAPHGNPMMSPPRMRGVNSLCCAETRRPSSFGGAALLPILCVARLTLRLATRHILIILVIRLYVALQRVNHLFAQFVRLQNRMHRAKPRGEAGALIKFFRSGS